MSELIDKYFAGEMTCEEKKDLFDRIESDEALKKEFLRIQNVVALTQILSRQDDSETSRKGKQHFMQLLFRKRLKRALTVSLKYAAVFAVLVVGTFYAAKLYLSEEFGKSYTIVTAPKGQRVKIELPDGTIAWLSPCSRLRFAASFNESDRKIELDGATYFDVAKNPDCPFRVIANGLQIEVVGTSFNVNTYKKGVVETSLLTGQIKISGGSLPQEYILTPGEKATYSSINNALKITQADVHVETGWCDDYLIFDSEPLIDVIEEIERWYGVEIELRCPQIGQDLLSGSFRHENIQNVIHSLSLQYKFKYEIHKDKITIY